MMVLPRGAGGSWCVLVGRGPDSGSLTWCDPDGLRVYGDVLMIEAVRP